MKIETVANHYQIPASTLRYYEREGLLGPVQRINGIRNYRQTDLDRIDFILCVKRCGMTVKQIKQFIAMYQLGDETVAARLSILQTQLAASEAQRDQLTRSIDHLKTKIADVQQIQAQLTEQQA